MSGIATAAAHGESRVTVVGSLSMDFIVRVPRLPRLGETLAGHAFAQAAGGKGSNQAVAAARLGARVAMIGCVGADAHGTVLRAGLEAERIDCAALATSETLPTGVALIMVDDLGQNAIAIVAGSNGALTPDAMVRYERVIAAGNVLLCQLETPADTVHAALVAGRRLGKTVVLNPAPAVGPLPAGWLPLVDYLIPNEVEAAMLTGLPVSQPEEAREAAHALQAAGARHVLITLGAQGVLACFAGGLVHHYAAPLVQPIDTTAAGDTFIGGFAARLALGAPVEDAIHFAQRAAALSVTRLGAQPSIPTLAELEV